MKHVDESWCSTCRITQDIIFWKIGPALQQGSYILSIVVYHVTLYSRFITCRIITKWRVLNWDMLSLCVDTQVTLPPSGLEVFKLWQTTPRSEYWSGSIFSCVVRMFYLLHKCFCQINAFCVNCLFWFSY